MVFIPNVTLYFFYLSLKGQTHRGSLNHSYESTPMGGYVLEYVSC